MLTAKESSELRKNMPLDQRMELLKNRISEKTLNALDSKIRETVAGYGSAIELVLKADVCTDPDEDIRDLLKWMGYKNVKVTSDFPWMGDDYQGSTKIKFSIPE